MSDSQRCIEYPSQHLRVFLLFARFDVPVGNVVPDGMIHRLACLGKAIFLDLFGSYSGCGRELTSNPVVGQRFRLRLFKSELLP